MFSFHRPLSNLVDRDQLKMCNLTDTSISALSKINKHKFSLACLGVLPNQLRKLLRPEMGDCEAVLAHLRDAFFWGGYKIWCTRKRLVRQVWKQFNKAERKRKQKKKIFDQNPSACKHPFHFLTKSADLSHQRLTRCPCSRVETKPTKSVCSDIRSFLVECTRNDSLDWKHGNSAAASDISDTNKVGQNGSSERTTKKTDLIRASNFRPP